MRGLLRRTRFLFTFLFLSAGVFFIVASAAIALLAIDRALGYELDAVAARVPANEKRAAGAGYADPDSIVAALRSNDVDVRFTRATVAATASRAAVPNFDASLGTRGYGDDLADVRDGPPHGDGQGPPDGDGGPPPEQRPGPPPERGGHAALPTNAPLVSLFAAPSEVVPVAGGSIRLSPSPSRLATIEWWFYATCLVAIVIWAALAVVIGHISAARVLEPVFDVVRELQRFGAGDFARRRVESSAAEFRELALAYNAASQKIQSAMTDRDIAHADMRRFIADAAHELRTPLTVVTGYIELLRGTVDETTASHIHGTIARECKRMRDCISKLLTLARLESPPVAPVQLVDFASIIEAAIDEAAILAVTNELVLDVRKNASVLCDPHEMQDAISNILANASKYAPGSQIRISLKIVETDAVLEISDDGPGMSASDRDHAFAPFYRGENARDIEGSGLGLSIVERVVSRAAGCIRLGTAPGRGTTFVITLPHRAAVEHEDARLRLPISVRAS